MVKMNSKLPVIGLLLLSVITVTCDKNEPDNPCKNAKPFSADFYIKEAVGDSLVVSNKALQYANVTFEAADSYDSYHWMVGNDQNISTQKKYTLLFTEIVEDIQVRLIATKKASPCFPNDKTIDTVYHTISVVPWRDAAIIGKYAGAYARTPNIKDTVEIKFVPTDEPFGFFMIKNVSRGCNKESKADYSCISYSRGYQGILLVSTGEYCQECPMPLGLMKLLDNNNTLEASITYGDTTNWPTFPLPRISDKFIGQRIN